MYVYSAEQIVISVRFRKLHNGFLRALFGGESPSLFKVIAPQENLSIVSAA